MLSNTFIVSEFVEILYSFPTWSFVKMCHTVPRRVPRTWHYVIWYHDQFILHSNVSYSTTTSVFHLAMCYAVPRPVQPSIVSCGTTTSVFHLAICYTIPQPAYYIWECAMRYHNQCIASGNVLCGTTTSVFHLAMCHTVPQPVPFTWKYVMQYHDQCSLAICHTVPQPVYFTWQYVIR